VFEFLKVVMLFRQNDIFVCNGVNIDDTTFLVPDREEFSTETTLDIWFIVEGWKIIKLMDDRLADRRNVFMKKIEFCSVDNMAVDLVIRHTKSNQIREL
jgi:hypothetical protein